MDKLYGIGQFDKEELGNGGGRVEKVVDGRSKAV